MSDEMISADEAVNRALEMISKQRFADWYTTGKFDKFITGDLEHETGKSYKDCENEIKDDIRKFLHLK